MDDSCANMVENVFIRGSESNYGSQAQILVYHGVGVGVIQVEVLLMNRCSVEGTTFGGGSGRAGTPQSIFFIERILNGRQGGNLTLREGGATGLRSEGQCVGEMGRCARSPTTMKGPKWLMVDTIGFVWRQIEEGKSRAWDERLEGDQIFLAIDPNEKPSIGLLGMIVAQSVTKEGRRRKWKLSIRATSGSPFMGGMRAVQSTLQEAGFYAAALAGNAWGKGEAGPEGGIHATHMRFH
ncbi:hypothetical protein EDD18DRAFT_1111028 [Armillaria luteobubalina]|uniref:Uncharacterized protein n=1 Tax=Armillaria luteobubalina TaxID=153913 RepID=A0AA39TFX7_9AGAR|nr:hypothetical protein EDD18DRAFT_1111028 [Armillaria luteobubalina]